MAALNPFEIFGLAPKFDLDEDQLQKKYLEVQRKVHPDRFASASDAEKRVAEQWAALINDAYHKLNDPVERGKLLCSMKGVVVDGERSGTLDETFLFDQLEPRESTADAIAPADSSELDRLKKEIESERQDLIRRVKEALDDKSDAALAAEEIKKIMFLNRQLQDFS